MHGALKRRTRKIKVRKPKFEVNEPGTYEVTVERAEVKQTRNQDDMMVLRLLVCGGVAFSAFLVCDGRANSTFAKNLAQCLQSFGFTPDDTDDFEIDQLINRSARVELDVRTTEDGSEFNYVKNWLPDAATCGEPAASSNESTPAERP